MNTLQKTMENWFTAVAYADAGQSGQLKGIARELPRVFDSHRLRAAMQVTRTCVVPQPGPQFEHGLDRRGGKPVELIERNIERSGFESAEGFA